MHWLVALASTNSVDLICEGNVVAVHFVRTDADNGAYQSLLDIVSVSFFVSPTIFLVHLRNFLGVAPISDYIVVELRPICCCRQRGTRDAAQRVQRGDIV